MKLIARLIHGDSNRKTRFHTLNGHLCAHPFELALAFASTIMRIGFKRYAHAPWLVYPATSHIAGLISDKRVFEFGSGMSSVWFSERCREVISVEHDSAWYAFIAAHAKERRNLRVIYANSKEDYLGAIFKAGGSFDLILIDGQYRRECLELARSFLNPNGSIVVDNTDVDAALSDAIERMFSDGRIRKFRGYAPGILHPNETTVIDNIFEDGTRTTIGLRPTPSAASHS